MLELLPSELTGWKNRSSSFLHTQFFLNVFVESRCHECLLLFSDLLNLFLMKLLGELNVKINVQFLAQYLHDLGAQLILFYFYLWLCWVFISV